MIRPVGFYDTWALSSTLYAKHRVQFVELGGGLDLFSVDDDLRKEWNSLRAFLAKVRAGATQMLGYKPDVSNIVFQRLAGPDGVTAWCRDKGELMRLHTCLVASPSSVVYSGGQSAILAVGHVNWIDHTALCSWVNFGDTPMVQLVVDLKKPADDPD